MDTFMDKLAQKLNAQEMIRANSAADAEELGQLRNQLKEYNECLGKLQKLLDDGACKLEGAQVNGEDLKCLVQDGIEKLQVMQQTMQQNADSIVGIDVALEEWKNSLTTLLTQQKEGMDSALGAQQEKMDAKLAECNENVHKECVKVYRNVQAVVVEEDAKQTESVINSVNGLKGKLNAILGVSIVALIASVVSIVIQILNMLNFKLF